MSKISLTGNASGTGVLTIAAPNTNSDRTLTLPDAAGTVFVSGQAVTATTGNFSGNVTLGSSVLETPTGSAPSFTCRAWVNFNGTGTVAIRASGNVSSITDGGTGIYTANFTTAMQDSNYASTTGFASTTGTDTQVQVSASTRTTTALGLVGLNAAGTAFADISLFTVAVFR